MKMMSIVCAIGFWIMVIPFLMNKLQLNMSDLNWSFGGEVKAEVDIRRIARMNTARNPEKDKTPCIMFARNAKAVLTLLSSSNITAQGTGLTAKEILSGTGNRSF